MAIQTEITGAVSLGDENSKYTMDDFTYPIDLFNSQQYGANYAMFYINVNEDGKLARSGTSNDFVGDIPARERGEIIGLAEREGLTQSGLFAANATANVGGAVLGNLLGVGGASGTAAALSTVGQGALAATTSTATRAQKRLKTAIALHMPNQMQIRYSAQYSEEDTALLSAMIGVGGNVMDAIGALGSNAGSDALDDAGADVVGFASGQVLARGPNGAANSALTGVAQNPKREQVFKNVNFREFTMEYQFFPRSAAEARNIQGIIHQFKYHMHPEYKENTSFLYIYPSEFDIAYYVNGQMNNNLHRHPSCVLTDMAINYTPNGNFTTFDDDATSSNIGDKQIGGAGMPVQINMVLTFRELALLTKEKIEKGY